MQGLPKGRRKRGITLVAIVSDVDDLRCWWEVRCDVEYGIKNSLVRKSRPVRVMIKVDQRNGRGSVRRWHSRNRTVELHSRKLSRDIRIRANGRRVQMRDGVVGPVVWDPMTVGKDKVARNTIILCE